MGIGWIGNTVVNPCNWYNYGASKYAEYEKTNHQWHCEYCHTQFTTDFESEVVFEANTEIYILYDKAAHSVNKLYTNGLKLAPRDPMDHTDGQNPDEWIDEENPDRAPEVEYVEQLLTTGSTTVKKGMPLTRGIKTNNPLHKKWWKDILKDGGENTEEPCPKPMIRICTMCLDHNEELLAQVGECKFYYLGRVPVFASR